MTGKKFRFNIIDVLILLVLAVAVAVLSYIFVFSDDTVVEGEKHTIEYVIETDPLNAEFFSGTVSEGDIITLSNNRNVVLGVVSKQPQEYPSYKAHYSNSENKEVYSAAEGHFTMLITFTSETVKDVWGYRIGDSTYLPVNNPIDIMIGDLRCTAYCVEAKVID